MDINTLTHSSARPALFSRGRFRSFTNKKSPQLRKTGALPWETPVVKVTNMMKAGVKHGGEAGADRTMKQATETQNAAAVGEDSLRMQLPRRRMRRQLV
jgi:hypothetical protein